MTNETKQLITARAATIRQALQDRKVEPDQMTAAALLYLSLKILKLPADDIIQSLPDAIRSVGSKLAHTDSLSAENPDGTITLTNLELQTLINSKVGNA